MRVQHVWAKTGTSPVAFHNTTEDVALCPGQEPCPGGVPRQDQKPKCAHIERARATVAPPHFPDPVAHRTRWARPWRLRHRPETSPVGYASDPRRHLSATPATPIDAVDG